MKQTSTILYLLLISICFCSCGRDLYVPNTANLLVLEEKNDLKANLSINAIQVAYSPRNNIGLKGDFGYVRSRNDGERNLNIGTIGLGYYRSKKISPLFKNSEINMRRPQIPSIGFDIFANVSYGKLNTNSGEAFQPGTFGQIPLTSSFRADLYKPNLSTQVFWKSKTFTVNFGVRYSFLHYFNAVAFGEFTDLELENAAELIRNSPAGHFEYDLKVSNGNNQIASFIALSWNQKSTLLKDNNSSITFGLDVNISNFYADKKYKSSAEKEKPTKSKKSKKRRKRKR